MTPDRESWCQASETALITAAARALESVRVNGWVCDPLAAGLAGPEGLAMLRTLPTAEWLCFTLGLRTRVIDELLIDALSAYGISVVLNLGAGLDTRPWRLPLPSGLRWVEVDLAPVLNYKSAILASATPRCRVESLAADLNEAHQRGIAFQATRGAAALILSEGLLTWLPAATVEAMAAEVSATPRLRLWLLELSSRSLNSGIAPGVLSEIEALRFPVCLHGEEISALLGRHGWAAAETRGLGTQALTSAPPGRLEELSRTLPPALRLAAAWLPAADPSGVYLFRRE